MLRVINHIVSLLIQGNRVYTKVRVEKANII